MNPLIQLKQITPLFLVAFGLACLALSSTARAVSPAPDGGYPGGNTAEGQTALLSLTTGGYNTAVGFFSLRSNTTNSFNTAVGAGTLFVNTADQNTATGAGALFSNTTGPFNTATGALALFRNTIATFNSAFGQGALFNNTTGNRNTATGAGALFSNTMGANNTAIGFGALNNNTSGANNVALGDGAGFNATTGSGNVYIGAGMNGVAGESSACYIASIFGQTSSGGTAVFVNSAGQLGTMTSSERFKQEIEPMGKASDMLLALKPVTFRYKKEFNRAGTQQFGLVAEEVEKVNRDLVVRDKEGKPYSVRYDQINAMLLNEFLKEHKTVQEQGATIAELKKQIDALTAGLQKVSTQLELNRPAAQTILN